MYKMYTVELGDFCEIFEKIANSTISIHYTKYGRIAQYT